MRDAFVKMKKKGVSNLSSMPRSPRGNPVILGDLDKDLQDWIKKIRLNGGIVNVRIVMAGMEAIVTKFAKRKLEKYGGHIVITKHLARSLLRRMGFVKRKGTKAIKNMPTDFEDIQKEYVKKVSDVVKKHNVPDELIINWDQTGCQLVPGGEWTMEAKGSNQISIAGIDDKRQITLLLAITKSGSLLPPQVIYPGKTDRATPKGVVQFPESWDITVTESHWSTDNSMLRYTANIIIPYVNDVRESLPLDRIDQKVIAIFDVFKAHRTDAVIALLKDNDIVPLYVPASCTDKLQPLDLIVNREFKEILKSRFHEYYANEVMSKLDDNDTSENIVIDLKTSTLKPINACWVIDAHERMTERRDLIMMGFRKAGLGCDEV